MIFFVQTNKIYVVGVNFNTTVCAFHFPANLIQGRTKTEQNKTEIIFKTAKENESRLKLAVYCQT